VAFCPQGELKHSFESGKNGGLGYRIIVIEAISVEKSCAITLNFSILLQRVL